MFLALPLLLDFYFPSIHSKQVKKKNAIKWYYHVGGVSEATQANTKSKELPQLQDTAQFLIQDTGNKKNARLFFP